MAEIDSNFPIKYSSCSLCRSLTVYDVFTLPHLLCTKLYNAMYTTVHQGTVKCVQLESAGMTGRAGEDEPDTIITN